VRGDVIARCVVQDNDPLDGPRLREQTAKAFLEQEVAVAGEHDSTDGGQSCSFDGSGVHCRARGQHQR
jgi:hypothetical protein